MELALEVIDRAALHNPQDRAFLEAAFTNYISAIAYSEIERSVTKVLDNRFSTGADAKIAHFLSSTYGKGQGRIQKSDIADVAAKFGVECKTAFNEQIPDIAATHYRNLLECRHKLSHGEPANETLLTAQNGLAAADHLLTAFAASVA